MWHDSTRAGHNGAFQRLERGEVDLWSFYDAFSDQLSDPRNVAAYAKYAELRSKGNYPPLLLKFSLNLCPFFN